MRALLSVGTVCALVMAAAPLTVTAAQAAPLVASKAPQPPPKLPKRKLTRQMPKFKTQPKVVKAAGMYEVRATLRLRPWATRRVDALADKTKVALDVSKKGVQIGDVGLGKKPRNRGLMFAGKLGPKVVKRAGLYTVTLAVPPKVGRSLASQTPKRQRQRLRMTVEHHKDVSTQVKGRDVIQVALSGKPTDRVPGRATGPARLSGNGESTSSTGWLLNYTPFTLQTSVQGVNCVSDDQWTGSMDSYYVVQYTFQAYTSGSSMANDYSTANSLSSDAISALKSSAATAGTNAAASGSALFTPSGAASAAVGWAVSFVSDFIKSLSDNSCSSQPSLFTTSAVVTQTTGSPNATKGYYGVNTNWVGSPTLVTFPAGINGQEMNGAQSSTQWEWNGGNPQPSGSGSFNWAGGLMSMAQGGNGFDVAYLFESDSANPTGYGPAPSVWPPNSAVQNSAGLTATWDGANMVLNCDPGQWDLYNPWDESLALTPGALSPANTNSSSGNQMYMAVAYNGTDAQGQQVYNQPFTGVQPVTSFSQETQAFTIDSSALQGITVDEWQCSIGASIQVGDWAVPSTWPTQYLGRDPNGSWWNAPNVIVTAPYVAQ